jgi:hypothetical protein
MEDAHFTRTEKSKKSEVKCENDAHYFLDVRGIVQWEFIPPGQPVNQEFYLEVLRRLRENVRRKFPEMWRSGEWFLHQDNAPAHTALSVTHYLAPLGWTVIPHPPYSLDLASCDFFLFPTMKKTLKGKRFATVEEVKTASQEALNSIMFRQFQRCFTKWEKILDKCIASSGQYFDWD